MKTVFGQDMPAMVPRKLVVPASMTHVFDQNGVDTTKGVELAFKIQPLLRVRIDGSHVILVTSGRVDTDVEDWMNCNYGCLYVVGAYFLDANEGSWKLAKSVPVVAAFWADDGPEAARVKTWAGHEAVLSFRASTYAQGAGSDDVVLIGLQPDRANLLIQTSIAEDRGGVGIGATDAKGNELTCDDLLNPKFTKPSGQSLLDQGCARADGSWRFAGDSVEFEFHGVDRALGADGEPLVLHVWHSTAVLRLQKNGSLKLVSGKLPVYSGP